MPYTSNKHMPRIRRDAARLFHKGWTARKIGRHLGYHHTAVMKWVKLSITIGDAAIPTRSSKPHTYRKPTAKDIEDRICSMRIETKRCALAIWLELKRDSIAIGKNTVHRILDRSGLLKKRSMWKRYHPPVSRPQALKPGSLVQIDTVHRMISRKKRIYVLTLIDVYTRCAYAKAYPALNAATAVAFLAEAQKASPFFFDMIQTDHGLEFGSWFVSRIRKKHRFTRIGKPNDNAHIERFNRTLQEECLDLVETDVLKMNRALKKYLPYYNNQRMHLGINLYPRERVV